MFEFLSENLGTIIVSAVLLVIVFFVVRSMIVARKKGKTTCGCGCANCAMKGTCHKK
ncbi:MAG: FeoB-associated Cys-rich membrane protein [Lachnospiraceae bacterium]|nr:FeoB-associated Cys-rich membrane protein [Lachnospiraceae bacterium]